MGTLLQIFPWSSGFAIRQNGCKLLLSGENPEHLYLCAYYSASLTKSSLRGLAQSLEETTEHRRGRKPPVVVRQRKKPRQGDRVLNVLSTNLLDFLSPL